jgi:hypothetical protein
MDGPVSIFADEGCECFFGMENVRAASEEIDPFVLGGLREKPPDFSGGLISKTKFVCPVSAG